MTIERFAKEHKLKISRDDCGEAVIRGKRGHLYFDKGALSAMWTDSGPLKRSRLAELGDTPWHCDIGRGAKRRRVQDAWVRGIKPQAYKLAVRIVAQRRGVLCRLGSKRH
jgi:hypothetical protein